MSPDFDYTWVAALTAEIGLVILLVVVLVYDRFLKAENRRRVGLLTAWGSFLILIAVLVLWFFFDLPDAQASLSESLMWGGMIRFDAIALVFEVMFLSALIVTSLIAMDVPRLQRSEFYALLITATIGFVLMAAAADLIMVYVALETASISSYVLAGFLTGSKRSSEAGMKYFIYGAFATGVMLYGMSLLYGVTGQTNIYVIGEMLSRGDLLAEVNAVILLAAAMTVVGFGFKIAAVPFHFWTPDVYQGSPTPFTAFVSTASKAAGFAVFLRVFTSGAFGDISRFSPTTAPGWWAMLVAMSIITMTLGNFVAIYQTNIKRLLAYSSIAQAGYIMIGLVALSQDGSGAAMFYLLIYIFTNIAAFGVIILVSNKTGSDEIKDLYGLNRRAPILALVMMFAVLSLAGIPPTAGFFGKFFLFRAAIEAGLWWLALIGIILAFVALYYYLGIIKYMYLYRSDEEEIPIPVSRAAKVGLVVSIFFVIYLGIFADSAFEWTRQAAAAFFTG
ncbi:MAG: NADH-quinone oxidoreductase subunit N [Anaerolineaceae bacterium]|nr:MAG: NADH-quinone oxidoreductase subunit N [Anaerolineaceae bacterium]